MPNDSPFIYMAPLRGVTDALFRRIYTNHFKGIDAVIAPFINPQRKAMPTDTLLSDIIPENNNELLLIPQLINNNTDDFLSVANRMYDLGYREINWNLGCPVPMVAKKRRGSGLLPYPEMIEEILDNVVPRLQQKLSIKMRLGFHNFNESIDLLPRLNKYPLTEIIIHARLGKQLYRGSTAPDHFEACLGLTDHTLVYNGDITSAAIFTELSCKLPSIDRWMIGRGLIKNPFLPAEIKGYNIPSETRKSTLKAFHDELYQEMKNRLSGPGHLLGRMKQIWLYFIDSFPEKRKQLKKITKANSEEKYLAAIQEILE